MVEHAGRGSHAAEANLGLLLKRKGDAAGAEKRYRAALELDPMNTDATYNLAALLSEGGRLEEARGQIRRLLEVDPGDSDALRLLRKVDSGPAR